jgi:hypothetical protein
VTLRYGLIFSLPFNVYSKTVFIDDTKYVDDFCHLQKYVKRNKKSRISSLLPNEKQAEYFRKGN